jgi:hypothetical protein
MRSITRRTAGFAAADRKVLLSGGDEPDGVMFLHQIEDERGDPHPFSRKAMSDPPLIPTICEECCYRK